MRKYGKEIPNSLKIYFFGKINLTGSLSLAYLEHVHTNYFMSSDTRQQLLEIVEVSQRFINVFRRLYQRKCHKLLKIINTVDLWFEEFQSKSVVLYTDGGYYQLTRREVLSLIMSSITNMDSEYALIHTPMQPRNPYTNSPMDLSQLYSIYWQVTDTCRTMHGVPFLIVCFFRCNFSLDLLHQRFGIYLLRECVNRYIRACTYTRLFNYITHMCEIAKLSYPELQLDVDLTLPYKELYESLRKPVNLFLQYYYTCDIACRTELLAKVIVHLKQHKSNVKRVGYHFERWPESNHSFTFLSRARRVPTLPLSSIRTSLDRGVTPSMNVHANVSSRS